MSAEVFPEESPRKVDVWHVLDYYRKTRQKTKIWNLAVS
jgi:hypothetical protein